MPVRGTPRTEPGTVAVCFVDAALEPVRARAMNVEGILRQVGMSPALLGIPQARVSAKQYGALWRHVALTLDDELFGQDSRRMKAGTFAMVCHSALGCDSLRQALDRCLRFFRLILDDISGNLHIGAFESGLRLVERGETRRVFGQECLLMLLHGLACWLIGRRIPITRAEFGYAEPLHSAEYRSMYTSELSFKSQHTTIFFESKYLESKVVQNHRTLKDFLKTAPEGILVKYKNVPGLAAKVRSHLRESLATKPPELNAMAAKMNATSATFRRRLHREGTSYRLIKDQLRRDLAISYVTDSDRSTTEIGWDLGYAERSSFERAFKQWTGATPGQFRRRLR
jgi:AraC-like DNA-binding protein